MDKINACDKIMLENQKKRKYGNRRNYYINLHLKDDFVMEFTASYKGELTPEETMTSFTS